jgi:hypothetical protein
MLSRSSKPYFNTKRRLWPWRASLQPRYCRTWEKRGALSADQHEGRAGILVHADTAGDSAASCPDLPADVVELAGNVFVSGLKINFTALKKSKFNKNPLPAPLNLE